MKRQFSFISFSLLGALSVQTAFAVFPDVPADHDNVRAIEYMQTSQIMQGYPNGTFGPDRTLNRAELMKIIVEAKVGTPDASQYRNCFPDVREQWFAVYVCFSASQNWVNGYSDGKFKPEQPVNMVEALKMLIASRDYVLVAPQEHPIEGYDHQAWYAPYVATALSKGIMSPQTLWGYDADALDKPLVRKRIAEFLYRMVIAEGKKIFSLEYDCDMPKVRQVRLEQYDAKSYRDRTVMLDFDLIGIDDKGERCIIGKKMNPYAGVSPHLHSHTLFLIDPENGASFVDQVPVGENWEVYLYGGHETAGLTGDTWELSLRIAEMHQISAPSPK